MTEAQDAVRTGELPQISHDDTGGPPRPRRFKRLRLSLKLLILAAVIYYVLVSVIPGVRKAAHELRTVNFWLLLTGVALEMTALYCYSLLTRAALGDGAKAVSTWRLFRIQMSTKALSSIVPGGSAAGSALGYRLMTLSGVPGPDAGFALATAGLGSAVVLNLIFWAGLLISIPVRGVNPGYATAALGGILVMVLVGAVVFGLTEGKGRAERVVRWVARKLKLSEDRAAAGVRQVGSRMEELASDKPLLGRVALWAAANWLLDVAALWVFLRAFGQPPDVDALIVAFGLVNVLAVIPILPGGLGTIDLGLPAALVGFGMARSHAFLGVGAWRLIQYFFPIVMGGLLYLSLRVGPWSISRRERLKRLRDLAAEYDDETSLDFAARFATRRAIGEQATTFPVEGDGFDDHGESKGVFPGY
ncbi:MAG: lysylphosphatidylglycerol synthase transmembrane domain-containing protein [Ilumatobacteraceae bacterium]